MDVENLCSLENQRDSLMGLDNSDRKSIPKTLNACAIKQNATFQ